MAGNQVPTRSSSGGWQGKIDWSKFYVESNIPSIGYDPGSDKLIIKEANDYSAKASSVSLTYDMKTGSWSTVQASILTAVDISNFVISGSGELVVKEGGGSPSLSLYTWDDDSKATANFNWTSKAYDMGYPALKKRLYKVIIHSVDGTGMQVKAAYDSGTFTDIFDSNGLNAAATITRNELVVTTPTNFSYMQLEISALSTNEAAFRVNDITLVYRVLGPR